MSSRGRICFHVPYVYPLAAGGAVDFVGGIEVQSWAVARGLADRGFDVAMATCDFGQGPLETRDRVSLARTYSIGSGVPGLRLVYPRLWKAIRTMHQLAADVYVANGGGLSTGWAYDAARLRRSKFVFLAASDKDLMRSLPGLTKRRERWWYTRALRGANARVAQTEVQRRLLEDDFGLDAVVIPYSVDLPSAAVDAGNNDVVLWLSTYKSTKRPEWFIELARRLPEIRFVMVGFQPPGAADGSWASAKQAEAELSNLTVRGTVEHSRIGELMLDTALFVHTSPLEGFPNTLLEAWSYGIPSVTAVDPDGVIERHGLGEVVDSVDMLTTAVAEMMSDPERRRVLGARARGYVRLHHDRDRSLECLATLMDDVLSGNAAPHGSTG